MKTGKIPEPILFRSVLKEIEHRREEILTGPGPGRDCAAIELAQGEIFVMSTDPVTGTSRDIGRHGVLLAVNDLAASGAQPLGVMINLLLPPGTEESALKAIMRQVEGTCKTLDMEVLGGHTEVTGAVTQPLLTLTGVGKVKKEELLTLENVRSGQDLVATKWIGLEATAIIAKSREEELSARFSRGFVEEAKGLERYLSVLPESRIAKAAGAIAMHDAGEGGIFGALWELGSGASVGLDIDLRSIPVRQETVEVCEAFDINPYQAMSAGSLLITTWDGSGLVRKLEQEGIHGAVIGKVTNGKDRIITNKGERRYLDKPQTDQLYKIYQKEEQTNG